MAERLPRSPKAPARDATTPAEPNGRSPVGSRTQIVYQSLRSAIIEQALVPGTKLPEDAIGDRLGVSRTLVRDAFARLASEGLVELRPNRGAFVAYPTLEEARDVFTVRQGLERIVVEQLAGRLTPEQVARLRAHVVAEDNARGKDGPESIRLAGEFHILLADFTGNALLTRYVSEVSSRCSLILAAYGRPHSSECAVSEHRELLECLIAGDAKRATGLMDHHLQSVMGRALITERRDVDIGDILAAYAQAVTAQ